MWQSLLLKLGMFAATMGVVFWIGWTVPASFDRGGNLTDTSSESSTTVVSSSIGEDTAVSSSPVTLMSDQPSTAAPIRSPQGLLDLNQATEEDFDALPGIGPRLAERILEYRKSAGAFHSLDELRAIKGIGKKTFERIRPLITVSANGAHSGKGKKAT